MDVVRAVEAVAGEGGAGGAVVIWALRRFEDETPPRGHWLPQVGRSPRGRALRASRQRPTPCPSSLGHLACRGPGASGTHRGASARDVVQLPDADASGRVDARAVVPVTPGASGPTWPCRARRARDGAGWRVTAKPARCAERAWSAL